MKLDGGSELPEEIGNLRLLNHFSVFSNFLWGKILDSIFNISSLMLLEVRTRNQRVFGYSSFNYGAFTCQSWTTLFIF
ncbi:hypothetical protein ACS0TY_003097 [Phlomoides rotata]